MARQIKNMTRQTRFDRLAGTQLKFAPQETKTVEDDAQAARLAGYKDVFADVTGQPVEKAAEAEAAPPSHGANASVEELIQYGAQQLVNVLPKLSDDQLLELSELEEGEDGKQRKMVVRGIAEQLSKRGEQ